MATLLALGGLPGVAPAAAQTGDDCSQPAGTAGGLPLRTFAGHLAEGDGHLVGMQPGDLAVAGGRVLVGDTAHGVVRSISLADRRSSVVAGTGALHHCPTADGTQARQASLSSLSSVAVDRQGRVLLAATTVIYQRELDGTLRRLAGSESNGNRGDGGPARAAALDHVSGLTVASDDSILFAQPFDGVVRRIDPSDVIRRVAGSLSFPVDVALDADGSILVVEAGADRIRRIAPDGSLRTVVSASGEGGSVVVPLERPSSVVVRPDGSMLVADADSIWQVADGEAQLIAGGAERTSAPSVVRDGDAAVGASIDPVALGLDDGDVLLTDGYSRRLLRLVDGSLHHVAGTGTAGSGDGGPATAAQLGNLGPAAVGPDGSVYFGDHDQVRHVARDGVVRRVAGARPTSSSVAASPDGQLATEVALGEITAIAVSPSGLVHFADRRRIHRIEPDGRMTVLTEMDARALAFGPAGLYAAVTDEHRVHRIAHDGTVTLVAGNGARSPENPLIEGTYPGGGGPAAEAGLSGPNGVDVDAAGNVFIGDSGSQRVRHVDTTGRITTYLSGDTAVPLADGSETVRLGGGPLEVDPTGNLDLGRHRYDAAGYAELLLGGGNLPFPADGTPATRLRLDVPIPDTGLAGFAIDPTTGDLVIVDATNRRLRRVAGAAAPDRLTRFAGTNRIATAMVISQRSFAPGEARAVVLARADDFADALAGAPLAADKGGPLLLSPGFGVGLAEAEIRRVLPRGGTVYLLGGPAALHPDVEGELRQMGYQLVRYAGADRFDTAVRIASAGLGNPSTIFLANGSDFPDALTAGAAAVHRDGVVLLTQGSRMPGSTGRYLAANPGRHVALGGPAATAAPRAERI
ncbi:MAG TPA: cell wall-binding repeat-containing protein, partial [Acidimicrobiales bacterium]|nr:cell wall-binding repeat-containing protein [Acidimicrobiales bacterium]